MKKFICAAACAVAAAALAPAGATALPGAGEQSRLVAAGTDGRVLSCATKAHDHRYTGSTYHVISASTTCGGAVQQSCTLTHVVKNGGTNTVLTDSVFGTTCSLSSGDEGEFSSLIYRTVVHAPAGMVWIGVPTQCAGVGTATLDCTFTTGESPTS